MIFDLTKEASSLNLQQTKSHSQKLWLALSAPWGNGGINGKSLSVLTKRRDTNFIPATLWSSQETKMSAFRAKPFETSLYYTWYTYISTLIWFTCVNFFHLFIERILLFLVCCLRQNLLLFWSYDRLKAYQLKTSTECHSSNNIGFLKICCIDKWRHTNTCMCVSVWVCLSDGVCMFACSFSRACMFVL